MTTEEIRPEIDETKVAFDAAVKLIDLAYPRRTDLAVTAAEGELDRNDVPRAISAEGLAGTSCSGRPRTSVFEVRKPRFRVRVVAGAQ